MTHINVRTDALTGAAVRLGVTTLRIAATADTVRATAKGLDWRIAATSTIDERIKRLERRVSDESTRSRRQAAFLVNAAGRYALTDIQLSKASSRINRSSALGHRLIAVSGAIGALFPVSKRLSFDWKVFGASLFRGVIEASSGTTYKALKGTLKQLMSMRKNHPALTELVFGKMGPNVEKWVGITTKVTKVISWAKAGYDAYKEFRDSKGSVPRRLVNAGVEGVASGAGGTIGGKLGAMGGAKVGIALGGKIGAAVGSVIPGAGTLAGGLVGAAVGGVIGGFVGGGGGAWIGSSVAKWAVNTKIGDKSVKTVLGDVADGAAGAIGNAWKTASSRVGKSILQFT